MATSTPEPAEGESREISELESSILSEELEDDSF